MSDFDPIAFGKLTAEVAALQEQMRTLQADVKSLLELANKSRGGFWAGMAIASALGVVVGWVVTIFSHNGFNR